jgi:putative addiction module CopG family antidote
MAEVQCMATLSVSIGGELEQYANELISSGRYANIGEVMRAALDALMREECSEEAKAAYLEQALEEAEASGVFEGDAFASVRRELGWDSV